MPRLLLFIFVLILTSSCSVNEEPVTKEEALGMSRAIDSSIRYKKPNYWNYLFNEKVFADRVAKISGLNPSADFRKSIKAALKQSDLGDKIIKAARANGTYQLVRQYEKDKAQHLLFRLYSDEGLNYHDFELTKKGGKLAVADMLIYLSGEELSKSIADLLTSFSINSQNVSDSKMEQVDKIKKMKELIERDEADKALQYYHTLPKDLKNQRSVRMMHIMICSQLDEATYMNAIDDYMELFPDAPNMHLVMIDTYILRKEYTKAIASIDKVDKLVTDPFLDYLRALMYNMMEKPAEARIHLEKLYRNMPQFDDGALELIANYIDGGDDSKARSLIKEYENNKDYDQSVLDSYLTMKSFNRKK
jgi:hypothetical protein